MIWLVGSRGMLGSEVEAVLRRHGAAYVATGREVDIRSRGAIRSFLKELHPSPLEWIVNCAGYTEVDRAEEEAEEAFRVNAEGPRHLAEAARERGAGILHVSTDYVFSGRKGEPYSEEDEPGPVGMYGKSKLAGEQSVQEHAERHLIIRTAWLFGEHGRNFVDTMLRLFQVPGRVRVVNDQWGSPTSARDLAMAIAEVTGRNDWPPGIYHFANNGSASRFDLASAVYEEASERGLALRDVILEPRQTDPHARGARRPPNSALCTEKFTRHFAVRPPPWREAVRLYVEGKASHEKKPA